MFYLGTHRPGWLGTLSVPLMVSHRTLKDYHKLPRARAPWMLDSGGFTELQVHGGWSVSPRQYISNARRFYQEVGSLDWISPQDWMCEPFMLERTGRTITDHQRLTVSNYVTLRLIDDNLPVIPVLQGWGADDYLHCIELYLNEGIDLWEEPLVGIGSVCRRQHTEEINSILSEIAGLGIRLHGFGVKTLGFRKYAQHLHSCDSMSWSYRARRSPPLPGCSHQNCANCYRFALLWRDRMLAEITSEAHQSR